MRGPQGPSSSFAIRGAIEGFYGRPYSFSEREALVAFLGARGMNTYVYAPKNDPLHRERWRELYEDAERASFARLARSSAEAGVRLFYAIAPGLSYDAADPAEFGRLEAKLAQLLDLGIAGIALLFDDIAYDSSAVDPLLQAEIVGRTAESLTRRAAEADFWFIGNYYAGTAAELTAGEGIFSSLYPRRAREYFDAYRRRVPPEVPILWTGPNVFTATLDATDAAAFRALVGRPIVVWDNFPVNDALPGRLFLGPYRGRDPRLLEATSGIVVNLMSQPAASRVPLATVADYLRDPAAYDPERSFASAVREIGGEDSEAFAVLSEHFRGHPVLAAEDEAPELARRTREAFAEPGDAGALTALACHLETVASCAERVAASARDLQLREEIAPWSAKLAALARAAGAGIAAISGRRPLEEYRALRASAESGIERVACTRLPRGLEPFVAGAGASVDRFAELFAAIEQRLEGQGSVSTDVT